jgi:hypothetical protein
LDYRHWDAWIPEATITCFMQKLKSKSTIDIMKGEPYDITKKPFGGEGLYLVSRQQSIIYVCKKKFGTAYAISTNTDLYEYNIETKTTKT